MNLFKRSLAVVLALTAVNGFSQKLSSVSLKTSDEKGLAVENFNGFQQPGFDMPVVSFRIDGTLTSTLKGKPTGLTSVDMGSGLFISVEDIKPISQEAFKMRVVFENRGDKPLTIGNIVPLGESDKQVYLTSLAGKGDGLSRTHIFRPGLAPANVTLPDNAWGIGLSIVDVDNGNSVVALARPDKNAFSNVSARRFDNVMNPGSKMVYDVWMEAYVGRWQEGFRIMFAKNMLYDVEPGTFDNTLFEREDLKWVRHGFVGHFASAWHNYFYDVDKGAYTFDKFTNTLDTLYGGDDFMILWTGFPVLGLDQRSQWDLVRAMPGGAKKLKEISDKGLERGMHLMTNYKPWDLPAAEDQILNATRYEDPVGGLGKISNEVGFWGVMFDTRSESSKAFQDGIDSYRKGFAIYPEGMSVPKDMQTCVIGRTHGAIKYAPFLNLNKLIKPEFCIYRQAIIENDNHPRRDAALSFFNGHGVEYHLYVPVELDRIQELYAFTGKGVRILRENADNFLNPGWTPLLPTLADSVWVNEWPLGDKTIYTLYSLRPEGFRGELFEVTKEEGYHFVDLWQNKELEPIRIGSKHVIAADVDPFPAEYLGTISEAEVSAIARFPELLTLSQEGDKLTVGAKKGATVKIWKGAPSYADKPVYTGKAGGMKVSKSKLLGDNYKGDITIQLFDGNILLDQRVIAGSEPRVRKQPEALFRISKGLTAYNSDKMDVLLEREKDMLSVDVKQGDEAYVYLRDIKAYPKYRLKTGKNTLKLMDHFKRYEGDFVVIVKQNGKTIDSTAVNVPYGHARIAVKAEKTAPATTAPEGMAYVPGGKFTFKARHIGDWMIKHPLEDTGKVFTMDPYYIDKHPVTNADFAKFMKATNYQPTDAENFLKHWVNGTPAASEEQMPVTYVSYEDAKAYAKWAGKRLPTEKEWQYAAQAGDGRLYPWGDTMDSTKCNVGNGILDPVGKYPQGANPLGLEELTGSVWQLTNDSYKNATSGFIILKGGDYFTTKSSWWYVQGGALPLINRQQLLRVSQGYERNATTGFRLVKDAQ